MSSRETTNVRPLGWPKAGPLEYVDGKWSMTIDYGHGETVRVTDPAWARQNATAYTVAANTLEAKLGIDMLPFPPQGEERRPAPEQTGLMPTIPPAPASRACNGCGQPVGDATPEELAAVAAGAPLPDVRRECANCRGEAHADVKVAP
ncbi:hypothetical protein [Nonomuraea turcica]|uniref:hypothetical protein n=1 Tax=Nonomuraea sp. G32 TaxID=3067274 RepID=UPI00273C3C0B|nr:hypothetical protein [Nonomuraea sp. G32]MDP4501015.1 hypothetical protein [Nonomuraea sp. G32]